MLRNHLLTLLSAREYQFKKSRRGVAGNCDSQRKDHVKEPLIRIHSVSLRIIACALKCNTRAAKNHKISPSTWGHFSEGRSCASEMAVVKTPTRTQPVERRSKAFASSLQSSLSTSLGISTANPFCEVDQSEILIPEVWE